MQNTVYIIDRKIPIKAIVFKKETNENTKEVFWTARNPKTKLEYRFSEKRIGIDVFLNENDVQNALRANNRGVKSMIDFDTIVYVINKENPSALKTPLKCKVETKISIDDGEKTIWVARDTEAGNSIQFSEAELGNTVFTDANEAASVLNEAKYNQINSAFEEACLAHKGLAEANRKITDIFRNIWGDETKQIFKSTDFQNFILTSGTGAKNSLLEFVRKELLDDSQYAHWYYDPDGCDWGIGAWKCSNCKAKNDNLGCSENIYPYQFEGAKFCPCCGKPMKP